MIGATLKSWRSRAMHVIVEGVGDKYGRYREHVYRRLASVCGGDGKKNRERKPRKKEKEKEGG